MSSESRPRRSHCCRHNHGEQSGVVPAAKHRVRRVKSAAPTKAKNEVSKRTKSTKSSSGRKRGANSPEGSSQRGAFLQHLVAPETASHRDVVSPSQLDIGGIRLVDEKGDADSLFVKRKSPRRDFAPAVLRRSPRPKTATPNRSSSRSPKRRGQRGRSPSPTPPRSLSAPGHQQNQYGRSSRLGDSIVDERRQSIPWSITELADDDDDDDDNSQAVTQDTREDDLMTTDDATGSSQSREEEEEEEEKRVLKDPIRDMMTGPDEVEEDYDTDLEETFPAKTRIPRDASGRQVYVQKCREEGVDPASYVLRHLTDPAFQLRHRYLSVQNLVPITKAMKYNSMIETLDLSDNHLEDESGVAIATMLENNVNITKVDISHNLVRGEGIMAFSTMLESNYTLKTLCLQANHLTDKDAIPLAEALRNNATLTELDLSHNDLGEMAGVYLGSGLAVNDGLNYLDLRWNAVRNKGIAALANALKVNTSLEVLDLSYNGVSVPGCIALMRGLKVNSGLRILSLSHNHINSVGAQKLSVGVKRNARLEALLLCSNPIGDEGMVALCKAVKINPTLKLFSVQNIPMPLIIHQKLRDVQECKDTHVLKLDVDGHKRNTAPSHVAAMVDRFISENQCRILNHCLGQDVENTGALSVAEIKQALWECGLDISKEQLDAALRQTKVIHRKTVPYRPLLDGLSALLTLPSWKAPASRVL